MKSNDAPRLAKTGGRKRDRSDFGTIRDRSTPSKPKFQAYYERPDGVINRPPKLFSTRGDAKKWLASELTLIQSGKWLPVKERERLAISEQVPTFGEFAQQWLLHRETVGATGKPIKQRTLAEYRLYFKKTNQHGQPIINLSYWDSVPIDKIRIRDVEAWFHKMNPEAPVMRFKQYDLFRTILRKAVRQGEIPLNPCQVEGAVPAKGEAREIATVDEIEAIALQMPEPYQLMIYLAAWSGLRFGEVTELRRGDFDFKANVVRITRGVTHIVATATQEARFVIGSPKSSAGIRNVPLLASLIPVIQNHLATHTEPGKNSLLFSSVSDPQIHLSQGTFKTHYYKARQAAGRPDLRFHDLRHTALTALAVAGATAGDLKTLGGHSTMSAVSRYQQDTGRAQELAARMDAARSSGKINNP